ncbi:MAG: hypothetical protein K9M80_09805 [Candidatus Marinimicrobia bacterium]|nr:hypothetical protein [Candidatus Neomarinimicrobiota bacterium]
MNKKFLFFYILVILLSTLFAEESNNFQQGSPKRWSQSKIDNYYRKIKLQRQTTAERPQRRSAIMSGNMIRTLVFDFGSIGAPSQEPSLEWPIYSKHGYGYEFGPLVGVEVPVDTNGHFLPYTEKNGEMLVDKNNPAYDSTFFIISDGLIDGGAPGASEELSPENLPWGWEPLQGYANPEGNSIAQSNKPETWPENWNSWPGTYKANAATADQAVYYVMDDRFNREFPFYPFTNDKTTGGMGLRVEVRAYQWSNTLASDAIFFVYEITNTTENDYENVVFGMFGDPHIGGSNDYSDDWAYFDTDVNMVYGYDGDQTGEWGGRTGYFGYSFLESPGNPYDGIDNDGDGMVDESMFNGIDDDNDWDQSKHDVGMDGIGPDDPSYPGPDEGEGDGVPTAGARFDPTKPGEPNFDVTDLDEADQIGLTSFNAYQYGADAIKNDQSMWNRLQPYTEVGMNNAFTDISQNSDNIFLYGSGYFPLKAGDTKRFSIALLMGEDRYDLFNTAEVVQNIYNSGYKFAKPPSKPKVSVVAGDGEVTLYWDDSAEQSWDPVYGYDFQGYAIYRATDPGFNECHTITNNNGIATYYDPIAKFDKKDGISGPAHVGVGGTHFDLGRDTGLRHEFSDTTVENGIKYYYAVCSYDIGDTTGTMQVPPSECTKSIDKNTYTGEITYDLNTVGVTPRTRAPGLVEPSFTESGIDHIGPGTGDLSVKFVDETAIRDGVEYKVTFGDVKTGPPDTVMYVTEMADYEYSVVPEDSNWIQLPKVQITDVKVSCNGSNCNPEDYILNRIMGRVKFSDDLFNKQIQIKYKYQPVFQDKYFKGEDGNTSFDGMRIIVKDDSIGVHDNQTGWLVGTSNLGYRIDKWYNEAEKYSHSYKIVWDEKYMEEPTLYNQYAPFRILDITYAYKDSVTEAPFLIIGAVNNEFDYQKSSIGILREEEQTIENTTWKLTFNFPPADVDTLYPENGDVFQIKVGRPFTEDDSYTFETKSAKYKSDSLESNPLDKIAVVPNPYCAQAKWEPKIEHTGYGRGERKVEFINLPPTCKISIYTITGELVNTIKHNSGMWDASESYNLLNQDNQEISFGIYIWHVDAKSLGLGTKTGKFAVIK